MNILTKIFGSKQDKDIKMLRPIVDEINEYYEEFNSLSDDEIKGKTQEFRDLIKDRIKDLDEERDQLQSRLKKEALDSSETQGINDRLKELFTEMYDIIQDTLDEIMPQAFAVVKQACARLKEQGYAYEYAGQKDRWQMVPYDVQLMGAVVLHEGKIAEMATGEGKTLVAIMPLYLNALPGRGAHLVTVNDYLARRDAEWMAPVYEFLGMSVGSIQ